MEIAMDLAEAMGPVLQPPAPREASMFEAFEFNAMK